MPVGYSCFSAKTADNGATSCIQPGRQAAAVVTLGLLVVLVALQCMVLAYSRMIQTTGCTSTHTCHCMSGCCTTTTAAAVWLHQMLLVPLLPLLLMLLMLLLLVFLLLLLLLLLRLLPLLFLLLPLLLFLLLLLPMWVLLLLVVGLARTPPMLAGR